MKIIGVDNLNREHIADKHVAWFPDTHEHRIKADEFCDWLNSFSCDDNSGGTYYRVVDNEHRLSRGMADLV